ncbi:hypothetical protein Leryth_006030 [Lithospermum erythrorhizon]|nr:hypothetical protein Leryth_006030 [Lithospermum erythrorhizon]
MEHEDIGSTPATPGTPGGPLFGGLGSERRHQNPSRGSLLKNCRSLKHFPWKQVPVYIGTQVMASFCASYLLKVIFHPEMDGGVTVPSVGYGKLCSRVYHQHPLMLEACWNCSWRPSTGASMNPVRSLGPAVALNNYKGIWIYLTAPILGTLSGAGVYTAVKLADEDKNINKMTETSSFRH